MNELNTVNIGESNEALITTVENLVHVWCDRRCCVALRYVLCGYPLTSGLTDDLAALLSAVEDVRAFARDELTDDEMKTINEVIAVLNKPVFRN